MSSLWCWQIDWGDVDDSSDAAAVPVVDVNIESLNEVSTME